MLDVIKNRCCIRSFIDKPVERYKILEVLKSAMQASSSKNYSPWEFIVADNKDRFDK